jgi:hypothetical protein
MRDRIVCGWRDRCGSGNLAFRDAEQRDRLKLQSLHPVHRADADCVLP